jgi:methylmalonyl-CoA/ethylmalonyl-CoA epimerase
MRGAGWQVQRLHHVAIAHEGDSACEGVLASMIGGAAHEEEGEGFVERMYDVGGTAVQTLEASGDGVVQRFLDRRGPGLHHIAFEVDRIDAALDDLAARGTRLIDREARAGGLGTRIAFLHPSALGGVLLELVEEPAERRSAHPGEEA